MRFGVLDPHAFLYRSAMPPHASFHAQQCKAPTSTSYTGDIIKFVAIVCTVPLNLSVIASRLNQVSLKATKQKSCSKTYFKWLFTFFFIGHGLKRGVFTYRGSTFILSGFNVVQWSSNVPLFLGTVAMRPSFLIVRIVFQSNCIMVLFNLICNSTSPIYPIFTIL